MKYFLDTEFIEGFHKHKGRFRHHVDLISVGVVCEDGREIHLISKDYDSSEASDWVKKNVLIPLYTQTVHGDQRNTWTALSFHKTYGLRDFEIAKQLIDFFSVGQPCSIEIYGYYSDYDWVVFCSIFGTMMDLPKGFPMYCKDLKQMLDEAYIYQENKYEGETRIESWLKSVKNHHQYPKQQNEHNALDDAKWNYELYKFITQKLFLNSEQGVQECDASKAK